MSTLRFGEGFELDSGAYELRRDGRPVRLERIPMEILLFLVARRPGLVTREEIIGRIWGQGVHLDTDNSINAAIRKIRAALKDDAEEPGIIRTVTGKGYRFVAAVTEAGHRAETDAGQRAESESPPAPAVVAVPPRVSRAWLAAPIALALLGGLGAYFWSRPGPAPPADGRVMLAVLPFDNLTGDPAQDYFSEGFTEELISRLGTLAPDRLGVIARTSSMIYKREGRPLAEMGRELGVKYVLEGSIRRDAGTMRITAQLIDVGDASHLWAEQYDREVGDVLRLQQEIALAIAGEIEIALGGPAARPAPAAPLSPSDYQAYDHYLRGRSFWNRRTEDGFRLAVEEFEAALALRPGDGRALAGLADTYALIGTYGQAPQDEVFPRAREAALRALEAEPRLAAPHASLALINEFHDLDWRTAEERFQRAIALEPNYATAHHWYAELLAFQGRFDLALAEIERARLLDPRSLIIAADRGVILYYARRYEEAIRELRAVLTAEPGFNRAHMILFAYGQLGRLAEAQEQVRTWEGFEPGPWVPAYAAYVQGRSGRLDDARRSLRDMEERNRAWKRSIPLEHSSALVAMGLRDDALGVLEEACRKHPNLILSIKVDPAFDPLREDARFLALMRCLRLDPPQAIPS